MRSRLLIGREMTDLRKEHIVLRTDCIAVVEGVQSEYDTLNGVNHDVWDTVATAESVLGHKKGRGRFADDLDAIVKVANRYSFRYSVFEKK